MDGALLANQHGLIVGNGTAKLTERPYQFHWQRNLLMRWWRMLPKKQNQKHSDRVSDYLKPSTPFGHPARGIFLFVLLSN